MFGAKQSLPIGARLTPPHLHRKQGRPLLQQTATTVPQLSSWVPQAAAAHTRSHCNTCNRCTHNQKRGPPTCPAPLVHRPRRVSATHSFLTAMPRTNGQFSRRGPLVPDTKCPNEVGLVHLLHSRAAWPGAAAHAPHVGHACKGVGWDGADVQIERHGAVGPMASAAPAAAAAVPAQPTATNNKPNKHLRAPRHRHHHPHTHRRACRPPRRRPRPGTCA